MAQKSVLITGCSDGGIGASLAQEFASNGFRVFATARNPTKMATISTHANITLLTLDPTLPDSVKSVLKDVSELLNDKGLDVLVNNAGQPLICPTLDVDIEEAKVMYDINLWGALRVTQAFAPLVIAAKGTLVYTCSMSSAVRTPYLGVYAGSKSALAQVADTLRTELAPFNVKVLTVMTGAIGSKALEKTQDLKLPEDSIYKAIETHVIARARGEDGVKRTAPSDYAKQVVRDVQSGTNGSTWRGSFAGFVKFMSSFAPTSVFVSCAWWLGPLAFGMCISSVANCRTGLDGCQRLRT